MVSSLEYFINRRRGIVDVQGLKWLYYPPSDITLILMGDILTFRDSTPAVQYARPTLELWDIIQIAYIDCNYSGINFIEIRWYACMILPSCPGHIIASHMQYFIKTGPDHPR